MYKGVMVGAGYWAGVQLDAWMRIPNVEIVALADRHENRLRPIAEKYNITTTYLDPMEMIEKEEFDFLDICTRPYSHKTLTKAGAEKGVHVLCQKPLGETMEEAKEIVQICKDAGVRFMVNENVRWQPWFLKVKELLEDGSIGQPFSAIVQTAPPLTRPQGLEVSGQKYFEEMEKLVTYELGVHFLDTARFLFGEANSIYTKMHKVADIAGEDVSISILDFRPEGPIMVLKNLWAAVPIEGLEITSDKEKWNGEFWGGIIVQGTNGTVIVRPEGVVELYQDGDIKDWPHPELTKTWEFPENALWESLYFTQKHFIDCLDSGEQFVTSGTETLKTMALVYGAYKSDETGEPVDPTSLL